MTDISHNFGSDLTLSPTGDLALASGTTETTQRVIRRLLTMPGAMLPAPKYGAGLPAMIGQPTQSARIAGIARAQMALESAVARVPVPSATVATDQLGAVTLHVTYADKKTGLTISATGQTGA